MSRPRISDEQRRTRLARRHAVAPQHRAPDPVAAARAVVALHATEAASVHLAVAARTEGISVADVDRALYEERSLVKQPAMRRTLFAFPPDLIPAALGSASGRVATAFSARIARTIVANGFATDGDAWWVDPVAPRQVRGRVEACGSRTWAIRPYSSKSLTSGSFSTPATSPANGTH